MQKLMTMKIKNINKNLFAETTAVIIFNNI